MMYPVWEEVLGGVGVAGDTRNMFLPQPHRA